MSQAVEHMRLLDYSIRTIPIRSPTEVSEAYIQLPLQLTCAYRRLRDLQERRDHRHDRVSGLRRLPG